LEERVKRFSGILPAIVTPVDDQGGLNTASFEALLQRQYEAGAHGSYVCGQTGEGLQLALEVRERAVEAAVANTPAGRHVIAHVGAASTADAVRLARHATKAGAHAVSSLPPGSAYGFDEVRRYYEALAAASGAPVLKDAASGSGSARSDTRCTADCTFAAAAGCSFGRGGGAGVGGAGGCGTGSCAA